MTSNRSLPTKVIGSSQILAAQESPVTISGDLFVTLLLKTRRSTTTSIEEITSTCRRPLNLVRQQLSHLAREGILQYDEHNGLVSVNHRLDIAVEAISAGADIERVSRFLTWQEFEEVAEKSLDSAGFSTKKHVVFKWHRRKYEIDLLGIREPLMISADCKHWRRNQESKLNAATFSQFLRTEAFKNFLPGHLKSFGVESWRDIHLVPVVIEIATRDPLFHYGVPIVPIFKLRSFLEKIDPFVPNLSVLRVNNAGEDN